MNQKKNMRRQPVPPAYQAALDYLYSFINYETKPPPSREHARFNLDRMRSLLAELGDPQTSFPSVVVAGTKGKGSTCALLEAMLRAGATGPGCSARRTCTPGASASRSTVC